MIWITFTTHLHGSTQPDAQHLLQKQWGTMERQTYSAEEWPIAACLHGIKTRDRDGVAFHDATPETWERALREIALLGFTNIELADSHIRPADLSPARRREFLDIAHRLGIQVPSVHVQRKSVIMPGHERENLKYAHRSIDAAAEWGMKVFSTGLHQPFSEAQKKALWFWTAPGPKDPDDPERWRLAVDSVRELGRHAAELGLPVAFEMYEDTYLGTAESAVRFVEEVGLENVGLNPDIANLIRLHRPIDSWEEMFEKTLPYTNYMHVKNYQRDEAGDSSWFTSTPSTLENGLINYRWVLARALDLGFDGIILTEQYGGDSLGVCARNQHYIRSVLHNHLEATAETYGRPRR